jgi:hypothetical protein
LHLLVRKKNPNKTTRKKQTKKNFPFGPLCVSYLTCALCVFVSPFTHTTSYTFCNFFVRLFYLFFRLQSFFS